MRQPVARTARIPEQRTARIPEQRKARVTVRATADQSTPDEPTAVLIVGAQDSGKRALARALLAHPRGVVTVPASTYLVLRPGPAGDARAYLPGCRQPQPFRPAPTGDDPGPLGRAPRRVELTVPDPLLRHFALVEAPCALRLGVAGGSVLADAAERGGAVVFVTTAVSPLTRAELDLLAELSTREISVFFAVVPGPPEDAAQLCDAVSPPAAAEVPMPGFVADADLDAAPADPVALALESHQAAVARSAPGLAGAPWFTVDPVAGDVAYLRRALVDWAGNEGMRRASANPPVLAGAGAVHVDPAAADSGWSAALDRWLHASTRLVRQRLAIEMANIHLRCVQDIVFGAGCASLPDALDRELHALSLRATAESDTAVATVVHDVLTRVLAQEPTEGVRRRVAAAVRRGLTEDPAGRNLERLLLVTGTGAVATVAGPDALAALPGYATEIASPILPPVGLGVAGGCYAIWRDPTHGDLGAARSWLQGVTRAVELELLREVGQRFKAVHRSLGGLIGETVDHGILLA